MDDIIPIPIPVIHLGILQTNSGWAVKFPRTEKTKSGIMAYSGWARSADHSFKEACDEAFGLKKRDEYSKLFVVVIPLTSERHIIGTEHEILEAILMYS
jgi:hypothetical protein